MGQGIYTINLTDDGTKITTTLIDVTKGRTRTYVAYYDNDPRDDNGDYPEVFPGQVSIYQPDRDDLIGALFTNLRDDFDQL